MEIFTYYDYLRYKGYDKLKLKKCSLKKQHKYTTKKESKEQLNENNVNETEEKYKIEQSKINNEHDKIFRKILDDKKVAVNFLNDVLKLEEKITENEIEKYNSSFISNNLINQEADIIYKLKDKNIFFLIEHQTKIDYKMPIRILEYELAIIKSAIETKSISKTKNKIPRVVPIVLYTGRKKWDAKVYIEEIQEDLKGYNKDITRYNVIDINNYTEEELLKKKSFLAIAMIIEKQKDTYKLKKYLEVIVNELKNNKSYTEEQKELLIIILELVLKRKIGKKETEKLIKKLKEDEKMLAVLEMIDEENKMLIEKGRRLGKKEGIKEGKTEGIREEKVEIAKKMLNENVEMEFISRITGLTMQELKNLKNNSVKKC